MLRDLKRELQRSRRSGTPGCLALADIDRFKSINDGHGHATGDSVLSAVSGMLIANLRPYDRSEEHTSELQSLTPISFAVFCLKKKNSYTLCLFSSTFYLS